MDEFVGLDAVAQAGLVAVGAVKPVELLEATIARIEALAVLNAATEWAGVRLAEGSRCSGDYVSPVDQELVARYRNAGLVLCGKTNTPEFGLITRASSSTST